MLAKNVLRHAVILNMLLRGGFVWIAELRSLAALASYVAFGIKYVAINQHMGPAPWGNTCWQNRTLQS